MVKLKYRKFKVVSIMKVHNILYWGTKVDFTDIPYKKPNITQVVIN
jgi:hypothetical protein